MYNNSSYENEEKKLCFFCSVLIIVHLPFSQNSELMSSNTRLGCKSYSNWRLIESRLRILMIPCWFDENTAVWMHPTRTISWNDARLKILRLSQFHHILKICYARFHFGMIYKQWFQKCVCVCVVKIGNFIKLQVVIN